jgi:hypothetical protein
MQLDLCKIPLIYFPSGSKNLIIALAYVEDDAVKIYISQYYTISFKNSLQKGLTLKPI